MSSPDLCTTNGDELIKSITHLSADFTFGVSTARYVSCLPLDDSPFLIDVPLGCFIVRWDVKQKIRVKSVKAHTDLITCMVRNQKFPDRACTVSHGGEVMHAGFSSDGTKFITSGLFQGGRISILSISPTSVIQLEKEIVGKFDCAEFTPSGNIFAVEEEKTKESVEMVLMTPQGEILKSATLKGRGITCVATNGKGAIALARGGRVINVVDLDTLNILYTLTGACSSYVKSVIFQNDNEIVCPSDGSSVSMWRGTECVNKWEVPDASVYYVGWSQPNSRIWLSTESGIHNLYLFNEENGNSQNYENDFNNYDITYHGITCCGVDQHSNLVAAGDFLGNLLVWRESDTKPFDSVAVGSTIRTVCWKSDGSSIQIGCLDGRVFNWIPGKPNSLKLLFAVEGGVTCLRWQHGEPTAIAAGTTDGTLAVFTARPGEDQMSVKLAIKAHKPIEGPQDLRFGSIQKYAEIWSVAWSPDNTMIATSSEDQKTHIWNLFGEKLQTLESHTTAVTSVDWGMTTEGEILATCADDQTVRIYNAQNWQLLHVFETTEVEEWHTITYLSLEHGGNRVAVATQSGYIFIWSLTTKKKLFGEKMHAGSVEGLRWNHNTKLLVSCSSDCTVTMFRYEDHKE